MKIETHNPKQPAFNPRSLTLTFETQAELDALSVVFNLSWITDWLRDNGARDAAHMYDGAFPDLGAMYPTPLHGDLVAFIGERVDRSRR